MASLEADVTRMTTFLPGPFAQLGILPVSLERCSDVPLDSEQPAMACGTSTVSDRPQVNFWASSIIKAVGAMAHKHADHPVAGPVGEGCHWLLLCHPHRNYWLPFVHV